MFKTIYTKWPACESLTSCLWRPGVQISSCTLSWHTNMSQVKDKQMLAIFNSPFFLLFQTLLFSSRSETLIFTLFLSKPSSGSINCSVPEHLRQKNPFSSLWCLSVLCKAVCPIALQHSQWELYCCIFLCVFIVHAQWEVFRSLTIVGLQPLPFPVCNWAMNDMRGLLCYMSCPAMVCCSPSRALKAVRPPSHSQEPSKLWTKINLFSVKFYFISVGVCLYAWFSACAPCVDANRSLKKVSDSLKLDNCEWPIMGAGNWTLELYKSIKCS